MEEHQIATAAEVEGKVPKTPQEYVAEAQQAALDNFKAVLATKPGRQAVKCFLLGKATTFLGQTAQGTTRKQRRLAAKQVAKRLTKKVLTGEEIF